MLNYSRHIFYRILRNFGAVVFPFLLLLPAQIMAGSDEYSEDVWITAISPRPPVFGDSPLGPTFVKFTGSLPDGEIRDYYMFYIGKFPYPKIGSLCNITYRFTRIKGYVMPESKKVAINKGRSIITMKCNDGTILH